MFERRWRREGEARRLVEVAWRVAAWCVGRDGALAYIASLGGFNCLVLVHANPSLCFGAGGGGRLGRLPLFIYVPMLWEQQ